jgi:hypothetical protein
LIHVAFTVVEAVERTNPILLLAKDDILGSGNQRIMIGIAQGSRHLNAGLLLGETVEAY